MSVERYWDGNAWVILPSIVGYTGSSGAYSAIGYTGSQGDSVTIDYTKQVAYAIADGTVNAYTATLSPAMTSYIEGSAIAIKINITNTSASTININGLGTIPIKDSKGNALIANKLLVNSIYTLRYNGTNFILQGEGATGTAIASDLLSGKTASTDAGDITGTMTNRSGTNYGATLVSLDTGGVLKVLPPIGYYDGVAGSTVSVTDADAIAANIKTGVNIFGVTGTATISQTGTITATAGQTISITGLSFNPANAIFIPETGAVGTNLLDGNSKVVGISAIGATCIIVLMSATPSLSSMVWYNATGYATIAYGTGSATATTTTSTYTFAAGTWRYICWN